jgi:ribosomal protein L7Ae-like RNA K-turn-binding protein
VSRQSSVYRLLGLARRAGAIAYGTEAVRDALRSGHAELVVFAGDASPAQLDKVRRTLRNRSVPQASLGDRAALGAAVGVAPVSALAVTSASFADRVRAELGEAGPARNEVEAVVAAAEE